jgi:hypothetical protein
MAKRKKTGRKHKPESKKLDPGSYGESTGVVTKGMAASKDKVKLLAPQQPLPHECNHAGRCCWGNAVGLIHYDIWRMIKTGVLETFGFHTTTKLSAPGKGFIMYGLGPVTHLPVCFIKLAAYQGQEGAAAHCPFLRWDDKQVSDEDRATLLGGKLPGLGFWKVDNKPRFICGLGPAKPVQCQIYPLGRMGEAGTSDDVGKWRFFCETALCRKCMAKPVRKKGCGFSVQQHLSKPHIRVILEYTRDYIDIITMLSRRNLDDNVRQYFAKMLFDFDSVLLDGGATDANLDERRPPSSGELMKGVAVLVAGVMAQQDRLRKDAEEEGTEEAEPSLIIKP